VIIGRPLMTEDPEPAPNHVTFAEGVKLARSKPERGSERSDLLVKDDVLQPNWHWSRVVGVTRQEAIERSRKMFFEQVTLVGEEMKLKKMKQKNPEKEGKG
jgi:hypothetical protein